MQDLFNEVMTAADRKLMEVFGGNTIHRNDGRHLHGGIEAARDVQHMTWHDRVIAHPHSLYFPPPLFYREEVCHHVGKVIRGGEGAAMEL